MEEFTISEVAKRAGIQASAIRYYESIKLLPSPRRSSGRRRYSPEILRQLAFIQTARTAGFSLAEIQTFMNGLDDETPLAERWQMLAQHKLAEVDALMRKAQGMKMILQNGLNCTCANLEECIDCIVRAETGR